MKPTVFTGFTSCFRTVKLVKNEGFLLTTFRNWVVQPEYYLSEMVAEPNLKIFSVIQNYVINKIKFINPNCFCLFNSLLQWNKAAKTEQHVKSLDSW